MIEVERQQGAKEGSSDHVLPHSFRILPINFVRLQHEYVFKHPRFTC